MEKELFEVNCGLIALALPDSAYPSRDVIHTPAGFKSILESNLKEAINGYLTVYKVGVGVTFVAPGNKVMLASHARVQQVELEQEDSKYPVMYLIIREMDIVTKV